MNQELQKENSAYGTKIRSLEAENKALMTEVEELKESIKNLEQAMDESILREERMLEEEQNGGATGDSSVTQRALKESRSELEQLRKKLSELEKKSAKTISELNKEVADLESLVEAKIYREDDLEREVERLKDKVQRLQSKTSSKSTSGGDGLGKSTSNRGNHTRSSTVTQQTVTKEEPVHTSAVCEICEQAGHDIFSCPLLKDDDSTTSKASSADMYCVDCDSRTHNSEFIVYG
jgi:chromosome segregation ATPase